MSFLFLLLFSLQTFAAGELPQAFTFDGRLYSDSSGSSPLSDSNITIKLQILDHNQTCILYEETQTGVNTSSSNGYFTLQVGSSTASTKRTNDPGNSMAKVYSNSTAITGKLLSNGSACTYTPVAGDQRYLRMTVTPSSTGVASTLSPNMPLNSVPNAMVAESLQGKDVSEFILANNTAPASLTQSNLENIFSTTNYPLLTSLLAGTSTLYTKAASNGTTALSNISSPSSPSAGQIWYDSGAIKFYNGSSIQTLGTSGAGITSLVVGTGLTPAGTITTSGSVALADTAVTPGSYGSATQVPTFTVDAQGRLTAAANTSISGVGPGGPAGGDLAGTYPNPTLAAVTTAGTGTKITYDVKGRVTSSTSLASSDIPSLDWSKITSGTPTTLSGYGITNAVQNGGGVSKMSAGLDASKPASPTAGDIYMATDTQKIYQYNSGSWVVMADGSGGGTVTSVSATSPLSSSGGATPTLSLGGLSGLGTANQILGMNSGGTGYEYKTVSGTSNQITVTHGANSVTLSTPQNIHTGASPTFSGMTLSSLSSAGFVKNNASGVLSGGNSISMVSDVSGTLPVANGGTGSTSFSSYGVVTSGATSTSSLTALGGSTSGSILNWTVTGPAWTTASFPTSTTANQLLYSSANNVVGGLATANNAVLMTNGSGVPSFSASSGDLFSQYALLAGRSGGQTLYGGTAGSNNITIDSTSNVTKGYVLLNPSGGNVGIGTTTPGSPLAVNGVIESKTGGIKFPDGTVQTSAASVVAAAPSFSVHKNGVSQTVAADTWVKLTWSTKSFDTNNNFASDRYTPNIAGKYFFRVAALCVGNVNYCYAAIYKNGVPAYRNYIRGSNTMALVDGLLDLNGTTDYVEAYTLNSSGTSIQGDADYTSFSGFLTSSTTVTSSGSGTTNSIPIWTSTTALGNSSISESGGNIGIGTPSPGQKLTVAGTIESTSGGIKFPDGSTQTTAVATGARSIASSTAVISTASTSWVDMPGMSVTVTTNSTPILIMASGGGCYNNTAGAYASFQLLEDGVVISSLTHQYINSASVQNMNLQWMKTPTAGSHTYKVQWSVTTGTETCSYNSSSRSIIVWQ